MDAYAIINIGNLTMLNLNIQVLEKKLARTYESVDRQPLIDAIDKYQVMRKTMPKPNTSMMNYLINSGIRVALMYISRALASPNNLLTTYY